MTVVKGVQNKFNRGVVTDQLFAREDVDKINNACLSMVNLMPKRLGGMQMRPGTEFLPRNDTLGGYAGILVPFINSVQDPCFLEINNRGFNGRLIPWVDDSPIIATSTTTAYTDSFSSNTGWTVNDAAGCTSAFNGFLEQFADNASGEARVYRTYTTDTGNVHYAQIIVRQGAPRVRIGISGQASSEIFDGKLPVGVHYLVFTPTANITITYSNDSHITSQVDAQNSLGGGELIFDFTDIIPDAPFPETQEELYNFRWDQSADVAYFCSRNFPPFKVIRWGRKSFSVVRYENEYGPFEPINTSSDYFLWLFQAAFLKEKQAQINNPSILDTDNNNFINKIYWIKQPGQKRLRTAERNNDSTPEILCTGPRQSAPIRNVSISITTTNTAYSVALERSYDKGISWIKVATYTTAGPHTYNDDISDDVWYRLRVVDIGTGGNEMELDIASDEPSSDVHYRVLSTPAAGRLDGFIYNDQPVGLYETPDWYEGSWGGDKPYPTSIAFYEGRLWFAGNNKIWGTVTDQYENFDRDIEGDNAAIQRTIGFGPVDNIEWLAPSNRLIAGTGASEISVRSSQFGEVLTDRNINLKSSSTFGSEAVRPIVMDDEILFVQRGGDKVINLKYDAGVDGHAAIDLNTLAPDVLDAGVKTMAIARNPETRVYCVTADGNMWVLLRDTNEDVLAWSLFDTGSADKFIDVITIPGARFDEVYVVMDRAAATGGFTIEKFYHLEDVVSGDPENRAPPIFDCSTTYFLPGTTITDLDRFNGESVQYWGWKTGVITRGSGTVIGGILNLPENFNKVIVGRSYTGEWVSGPLIDHGELSVTNERKRVINTGLIMKNYVQNSVYVSNINGPDTFSNLPLVEGGVDITDAVIGKYNRFPFEFNGESEEDPRIRIQVTGPADILALSYNVKLTSKRTQKRRQSDVDS